MIELDKIIQGHTLDMLKIMPDKSINCIITSPPYWSLRSYKTEGVIWDGDHECLHDFISDDYYNDNMRYRAGYNSQVGNDKSPEIYTIKRGCGKSGMMGPDNPAHFESSSQFCSLCGAWKGELGLEPKFQLYIKHLVSIFDETKRVLRDDGCLFVNLGDTYASYGGLESRFYHGKNQGKHQLGDGDGLLSKECSGIGRTDEVSAKSLCLIPEHFVIAMVDSGWICTNKIIWHKVNSMPSSAKDRFSPDFEFVYFFVKKKHYYFEQLFEPQGINTHSKGEKLSPPKEGVVNYSDWSKYTSEAYMPLGRNKRCVWSIPTKGLGLKHYAAFPEGLIEPMILSGCPEFVCSKCGKPRKKIYEYSGGTIGTYGWTDHKDDGGMGLHRMKHPKKDDEPYMRKEIGYTDCGCNASFDSGIVLDPFMGAGTCGVVAKKLNRHYLGIELNPQYIKMAEKRIKYIHVQQTLF